MLAALAVAAIAAVAAAQIPPHVRTYPPEAGVVVVGSVPAGVAAGSGGPGPTAAFSCTPLTGAPPLEITCTDASTSGDTVTSWAWNFGDLGTSTDQNPTHEYAADGSYTVTLVARSVAGSDTETKVAYVEVVTPPSIPEPIFYVNMESSTPTYLKAPMTLTSYSSYFSTEMFGVPGKVGNAVESPGNGYSSTSTYEESMTWDTASGPTISREHTCNVWLKAHDEVDGLNWGSRFRFATSVGLGTLSAVTSVIEDLDPSLMGDSTWSTTGDVRGTYSAQNKTPGTWHMFTVAHYADGANNRMKLWIDGAIVTPASEVLQVSVNRGGALNTFTLDLGGTQMLDELACWNELLTQGNVDDIYNGGAGVALPYP
jgi:PKD repeat protein